MESKKKYTQEELANLHYTPKKKSTRLIDLTGKTFYEWKVLEQAPPTEDGKTMWKCRCSCGKLGLVSGYDLKNGKHKSCGHDRDHGLEDLIGVTFGELTVIGRAPNDKYGITCWYCRDADGNERIARAYDLKTGKTNSCNGKREFIDLRGRQLGDWIALEYVGNSMWKCQNTKTNEIKDIHSYSLRHYDCYKEGYEKERKFENLAGKEFNEWKVLRYVGGRHSLWECRCSCGVIRNVAAYDLKTGKSTNCGHNRNKLKPILMGKTFGKLKVIKYTGKGSYQCLCSCGKLVNNCGSYSLLTGQRVSCGCAHKTIYTKEYLSKIINEYISKNGYKPMKQDLARMLNITYTYVSSLVSKYNLSDKINMQFASHYEKEIYDVILKIDPNIKIIMHNRSMLSGYELDIYLPEYKLGIEFNGDYWHSDYFKEVTYHQDKTIEAAKQGIRLINIFEYEWKDDAKRHKLVWLLQDLIGKTNNKVIYARNCTVRKLDTTTEKEFLCNFHLQNYVPSHVAYGLYNEGEIISVMTFGKPRMDNEAEWEILRYCSKPGIAIAGGAEKMYKSFTVECKPSSIISYCDISKFIGSVYIKLGMKTSITNITSPNYRWVSLYGSDVITRYKAQKQNLLDMGLGIYGDTENEIMTNLGYLKVYDCGNLKFTWQSNL